MVVHEVRIHFIDARINESYFIRQSFFTKKSKPILNIKVFHGTNVIAESGNAAPGNHGNWTNSKVCTFTHNSNLQIVLYDNAQNKELGSATYLLEPVVIKDALNSYLNKEFEITPIRRNVTSQMTVNLHFSYINSLASYPSSTTAIGFDPFLYNTDPLPYPIQPSPEMMINVTRSQINLPYNPAPIVPSNTVNRFTPNVSNIATSSQVIPNIFRRSNILNAINLFSNSNNNHSSELNVVSNSFQNILNSKDYEIKNYGGFKPLSTQELSNYLGPMPSHFSIAYSDEHKKYYYKNRLEKSTSYLDPRLECLLPNDIKFSSNWKLVQSNHFGIPIFVNEISKEVTFNDPRTGVILLPCAELFVMHKKVFKDKTLFFQKLCSYFRAEGQIKLPVNRKDILESAFDSIMKFEPYQFHRHLFFSIENEIGLDYGGLKREILKQISAEILNPMYGLFSYVDPERNYFLRINQASNLQPRHLSYFRFFGRILGLILFHHAFLHRGLNLIFYKMLLGRLLTLEDIEPVDEQLYKSLKFIKENEIDDLCLEMHFVYECEFFGKSESFPLIEDGENILVTDSNKEKYLQLYIMQYLTNGVRKQLDNIRLGISEIVPLTWLMYFQDKELELLLCGMQNIDVTDWKKNTVYKNNYNALDKNIIYFWELVEEMDDKMKCKLLQFCTGSCQLPVGGFSQLMGSVQKQMFTISKVENSDSFPKSQTCFNRLILPAYNNKKILKEKLIFAVQETEGFHQE